MQARPSLTLAAMVAAATLVPGVAAASEGAAPSAANTRAAKSAPARTVRRYPSPYGEVFVVDEGGLRYLRLGSADGDDQSVIRPAERAAVPMPYLQTAAIGLAFTGELERFLMIGLGGGGFSTLLRRYSAEVWIDAVEIDPVVVDVARAHFFVDDLEDARFDIHVEDGARFISRARHRYDLVLLDAYGPGGVPLHLATEDFFRAVLARTAPGGAVVLNLAVEDELMEPLARRFGAALPRCVAFRVPEDDNLVLVGTRHAVDAGALARRVAHLDEQRRLPFRLGAVLARMEPCPGARDPAAP